MSEHDSWNPRVHTTAREMGPAGWEPLHASGRVVPARHHHAHPAVLGYAFVCAVLVAAILLLLHVGGPAL